MCAETEMGGGRSKMDIAHAKLEGEPVHAAERKRNADQRRAAARHKARVRARQRPILSAGITRNQGKIVL